MSTNNNKERKRKIDLGGGYESKRINGDANYLPTAVGNDNDNDNGNDNTTDEVINPWTGHSFSDKYYSILAKRRKLPVYQFKKELIDVVNKNQIVVVEGETGSGCVTFVCACICACVCIYIVPSCAGNISVVAVVVVVV